jgi:hypothetical protein
MKKTLLSLLGIDFEDGGPGRDASGVIYGDKTAIEGWEDTVYLHHASFEATGIVTKEWYLAHVKDHDSVLFNRKEDPAQVNNLAYEEAYAKVKKELTEKLYAHHEKEKNDRVTVWLKQYLT